MAENIFLSCTFKQFLLRISLSRTNSSIAFLSISDCFFIPSTSAKTPSYKSIVEMKLRFQVFILIIISPFECNYKTEKPQRPRRANGWIAPRTVFHNICKNSSISKMAFTDYAYLRAEIRQISFPMQMRKNAKCMHS